MSNLQGVTDHNSLLTMKEVSQLLEISNVVNEEEKIEDDEHESGKVHSMDIYDDL